MMRRLGHYLTGMRAAASLGFREYLWGPIRRRRYDRRSESFLFLSRDGLHFHLDPHEAVDRHIAVDGIYERRFLTFIKDRLPAGAVMLDVGANIGNHALFLKDRCSQIHCFEPNPRALKRLRKNIAANHAGNIAVHPFGLGSSDRTEAFVSDTAGNLGGSHFLISGSAPESGTVTELPIRRGEAAVEELNLSRIDFIKIDVEGFENEVFAGLARTIAAFRPIVAFEHHGQDVSLESYREILDCLPNYEIFELTWAPSGSGVIERTLWHIAHGGQPELTRVLQPERRTYGNLLAFPEGLSG